MKISIIDYGMGNLYSVEQAFLRLGADVEIASTVDQLQAADGIVLPGVGAFPDAMEKLSSLNFDQYIKKCKKPLLGICLGMQLLFERSEEVRETEGLGIFKGKIKAFEQVPRVPHIGWNDLTFKNEEDTGQYVYFVHSFHASDIAEEELVAYCTYGDTLVPAIMQKNNFTGMQFHPEKSGQFGIRLLERWLQAVKEGDKAC